jgi:hypothetical protein
VCKSFHGFLKQKIDTEKIKNFSILCKEETGNPFGKELADVFLAAFYEDKSTFIIQNNRVFGHLLMVSTFLALNYLTFGYTSKVLCQNASTSIDPVLDKHLTIVLPKVGIHFLNKIFSKYIDCIDDEKLWKLSKSITFEHLKNRCATVLKSLGRNDEFSDIRKEKLKYPCGFLEMVDFEKIYLETQQTKKQPEPRKIRQYIKNKIDSFPALKKKYTKELRSLKLGKDNFPEGRSSNDKISAFAKKIYENRYKFDV